MRSPNATAASFTNRAALHEWLQAVGRASGERVWCFPMDEDFDAELESHVADVMQCTADSKGDHILAARFLSRFVARDIPWVHVDLAPSERKGGLAHVPTDFTGFGVRYRCTCSAMQPGFTSACGLAEHARDRHADAAPAGRLAPAPARRRRTWRPSLPFTARRFARAIVMPNLKPPMTTTARARGVPRAHPRGAARADRASSRS